MRSSCAMAQYIAQAEPMRPPWTTGYGTDSLAIPDPATSRRGTKFSLLLKGLLVEHQHNPIRAVRIFLGLCIAGPGRVGAQPTLANDLRNIRGKRFWLHTRIAKHVRAGWRLSAIERIGLSHCAGAILSSAVLYALQAWHSHLRSHLL